MMHDEGRQEEDQFEKLIQGLIDDEYGCENDFFPLETIAGLRSNLATLNASGNMKSAGIGNKMNFQNNKLIRGDKVNWINDQTSNTHEAVYLRKIWRFINHMNKTCFTSISTFESHYTNFEIGSFYKRHLDQFKSEKGRKFSIVLYLNHDWKAEDGGTLSLYPTKGDQREISPLEGRIVFFRSDEMEHEVYPSFTRERNSIAGWLKN
ncbi:MAG TPA: 2OG-Fe(II) oxygenase [Saprospiraceae bacterium]|nr:2OG-Fe(II) oxygenase [Saprospiraceae bacterium]